MPKQTDSSLLEFLSKKKAYPFEPYSVDHVQTHISHVFIASPFVYKIKKPVDFGFLDFSSLEKRKHFCQQEIELNRRLCSDIYLGVVPISSDGINYFLESEERGSVIEYAVKMRKLEDKFFLHTIVDEGELQNDHLDRVANKLSDFYQQQNPSEKVSKYGQIDHIRFNTDENFEQTREFIGDTIDEKSFDAIKYFTNTCLKRRKTIFEHRIEDEQIVDGHGDLHLEHIHITPHKICIYDCIEFNKRFRYGDVAADLAYLAMELDLNDCEKQGEYFIDRMAEKMNDHGLLELINFYKCYRAYVKGKVKSLQSREKEVEKKDRELAQHMAQQYFRLSLRYALFGSVPTVLIFMGKIGTGKSTLANQLASVTATEAFSSDAIRKSMAGLPLHNRPTASQREALYTSKMTQKTYSRLLKKAEEHLQKHKNVILDATFSGKKIRHDYIKKFKSLGANFLFVETKASIETIKRRLKKREEEHAVTSDARLEDFDKLESKYVSPEEIETRKIIHIDTESDLDETIRSLYQQLIDHRLS